MPKKMISKFDAVSISKAFLASVPLSKLEGKKKGYVEFTIELVDVRFMTKLKYIIKRLKETSLVKITAMQLSL